MGRMIFPSTESFLAGLQKSAATWQIEKCTANQIEL